MNTEPVYLKKIIETIRSTSTGEIDCEECFQELDAYAERKLYGKNAAEAYPLVEDHLKKCKDCREEYEALLEALGVARDLEEVQSASGIFNKFKQLFISSKKS